MYDKIRWTSTKLKQFREAYEEAVKADVPEFTFEGHVFLLGYGGYLIEYLEMTLEPEYFPQ